MGEIEKMKRSKKIDILIGGIAILMVMFIMICAIIVFWDKENKTKGELIMIIIFMIALLIVIGYITVKIVHKAIISHDWNISNCQERKKLFDLLKSKKENLVELILIDSSHLSIDEKNLYHVRNGKFYVRIISDTEVEVIAETEDGRKFRETERISDILYFNKHYKVK